MYRTEIRERFAKYVEAFLENRKLKLKWAKLNQRGWIKKSNLSVTLFSLKINSVAEVIPKDMFSSMYVDDVLMACAWDNMIEISERIQRTVRKIEMSASRNGFEFLHKKTSRMVFSRSPPVIRPQSIALNGISIKKMQEMKFLGLYWDERLSWNIHIANLKQKCTNALNLLGTVSSQKWEADQETLLRMYLMLVRIKIDYGCIVYGAANCCCCLGPPAPSWSAEAASASALKRTPIYLDVGFP